MKPIDVVKTELKAQVDQVSQDPLVRTEHLLAWLQDDVAKGTIDSLVRAGLLVNHCLNQDLLYGTLTPAGRRDVMKILESSLAILAQKEEFDARHAILSDYLYIASHLQAKNGDYWASAWLQLSSELNAKHNEKVSLYQEYSYAQMRLRLGHLVEAKKLFESVISKGFSKYEVRARVNLAKIARLLGAEAEAQCQLQVARNLKLVSQLEILEIDWELALLEFQFRRSIALLRKLTSPKASHYTASYILEAFLVTRMTQESTSSENFPKIASLVRYKTLQFTKTDPVLHFARRVDEAFDGEQNLDTRIRTMGDAVSMVQSFRPLELKLWGLLVASNWARLMGLDEFQELAFCEYQYHCRSLSQGKTDDYLNISRHWLQAA